MKYINFPKRFQSLRESFLEQDDLWWVVGGSLLHTGLLSACMPCFLIGVHCLPKQVGSYQRAVIFLSLSVSVYFFWQGNSYYDALSVEFQYPLLNSIGAGIFWYLSWLPWTAFYVFLRRKSRYYFFASLWILFSNHILELIFIGFAHMGPMLVDTPWQVGIYWFGDLATFMFVWSAHLTRVPMLRHAIWFIPIYLQSFLPLVEYQPVPKWLDEISIYPEGVMIESNKVHKVQSRRIHKGDRVYYASVGYGDVFGMSLKRHMVFLIEGGYTPVYRSRILEYHGHKFLLLICNDALYSDIADEINEAEAVVVVSWLTAIERTPIRHYFQKRVLYTHMRYAIPLRHVDIEKTRDYPF